jgi:hypothetical protein
MPPSSGLVMVNLDKIRLTHRMLKIGHMKSEHEKNSTPNTDVGAQKTELDARGGLTSVAIFRPCCNVPTIQHQQIMHISLRIFDTSTCRQVFHNAFRAPMSLVWQIHARVPL